MTKKDIKGMVAEFIFNCGGAYWMDNDMDRIIAAVRADERAQSESDFAAWVHEYANSKYGSPEKVIEAYKADTERA